MGRGSTRSRMAGAGFLKSSIITWMKSWAGMWQSRAIAGPPWSRFAKTSRLRATKAIAPGLQIRCDWGPQYVATAWIQEVKWLGITISPSYVGEPQCNGVAERFMWAPKEKCLYLHQFEILEQARQINSEFTGRENTQWLIERVGHRTPAQVRAHALTPRAP